MLRFQRTPQGKKRGSDNRRCRLEMSVGEESLCPQAATVGVGLREEWKIIGNSRNTEGIGKRHTRPIPPSYLYTHLNSPGLC